MHFKYFTNIISVSYTLAYKKPMSLSLHAQFYERKLLMHYGFYYPAPFLTFMEEQKMKEKQGEFFPLSPHSFITYSEIGLQEYPL